MGRTFIVASLKGLRGEANIIDQTVYRDASNDAAPPSAKGLM